MDPTSSFIVDIIKGGAYATGMLLLLLGGAKKYWLFPRELSAQEEAAERELKAICDGYEARLKVQEDGFVRERQLMQARLVDAQQTAAEWKAQAQSATRVTGQAVAALPAVVNAVTPVKTE